MHRTFACRTGCSNLKASVLAAAVGACALRAASASAAPSSWLAAASGPWTDPSRWSSDPFFPNNGAPPGTTYDAVIAATGAAYEVLLDATTVPGGRVTVDSLAVNSPAARVRLGGGSLNATSLVELGAGTIAVAGPGTLSAPHVRLTGGGTLELDGELNATTLTISAVSGTGTFVHRGGVTAQNIVLGPGGHFDQMALSFPGLLLFDDFHQAGGTARFGEFWAGVQERAQAYRVDDGSFFVNAGMYVGRGNDGTFAQAGGHVQISALLNLGVFNGTGRYHLSGGSLEASTQVVGDRSPAVFTHTGGTNFGNVTIGREDNGRGTYLLGAGTLHVPGALRLGDRGAGTFAQTGGHVRIDSSNAEFALLVGWGGHGVYDLSGGSLVVGSSTRGAAVGFGPAGTFNLSGSAVMFADRMTVGYGTGTFNQSGGTFGATVLQLGAEPQGAGRYLMSAGRLIPNTLSIGAGAVGGNGTFAQSGGTVSVTTELALARTAQSRGHYAISGGRLTAPVLTVAEAGPASFVQSGGTVSVDSRLLVSGDGPAVGSYHLGGGTLLVPGTLRIDGPGSMSFAGGRFNVGTLALSDDARLITTSGANKVLRASTFEPAGSGWTIDLNDNAMVMDYAAGASPIDGVRQMLAHAYADGAWDVGGLTSSASAAAATTNRATGIGYAEASELFSQFPATFAGEAVDDTAVLLRHTLYGDADLNGVVNLHDFNILAANFGQTGRRWSQGDFTYGGSVTLIDFNLLAANFGYAAEGPDLTPRDWAILAAAVPEPALAGLGLCAASLMPRCGRRARRRRVVRR